MGIAINEPFLVSCIVGRSADASVSAPGNIKERFSTLAFLMFSRDSEYNTRGMLSLSARARVQTLWVGYKMNPS